MGSTFSATNLNGNHFHQIIPNLYIGDKYSIYEKFFANKKILVINATNDLTFNRQLNSINVRVPVNDDLSQFSNNVLAKNLPKVIEIIKTHLDDEFTVLVHCVAGRQRSCAIVAAYLMKYGNKNKRTSIKEAIEFIKRRRPYAFFLNVNFEKSLKIFNNTLK